MNFSNACMSSGLYVPDDDRWPEHFRGIGIRIEDSVCVQEGGPLVLTTEALKEVDQLVPKPELLASSLTLCRLLISKHWRAMTANIMARWTNCCI